MVNITESGDILIAELDCESLDASNSSTYKKEVNPKIETGKQVVLDLNKTGFVDSSGLGALLSSLRMVNSNKGELVICSMTSTVRSLFELVRMHKVFSVYNTREEAVKSFGM